MTATLLSIKVSGVPGSRHAILIRICEYIGALSHCHNVQVKQNLSLNTDHAKDEGKKHF